MAEKESQMDAILTNSTSEPEHSDEAVAVAASVPRGGSDNDDALIAQKLQAVEQLSNVFGFSYDIAHEAVDYIVETTMSISTNNDDPTATSKSTTAGTRATPSIDITACYNYILDSGLGQDRGGPITPIDDCPHVTNHCKISIKQIPIQPSHAQCSYVSRTASLSTSTDDTNIIKRKGNLKSDLMYDDEDENEGGDASQSVCKAKENWLCLECGIVRCSRYCSGHALQHWEDTKHPPDTDGHCIAVSLSDLSVWCHVCQSYLSTNLGSTGHLIHPLVNQLEYNKFHLEGDTTIIMENSTLVEQTPSTKKVKRSDDYTSIDELTSENNEIVNVQAMDDDAPEKDEDEKNRGKDKEEDEGDDDENDDEDDDQQSLIKKLKAFAEERGIPLEWLIIQANRMTDEGDDEDDTPVVYPFDQFPTSIDDVAKFILSDKCKKILILAGAGMSVASGIPDFRSADGLYATLNPQLLSADDEEKEAIRMDPTISLDHHMFLQNPLPCLELQREFILGTQEQRWKATLAHRFIELLHTKTKKLARHYTQNIDGLEDQCTQLPTEKVIAVHGSMDRAECARCHTESDFNDFCNQVRTRIKDLSGKDPMAPKVSTPIECKVCGFTSMKPAIVLFRSSLPKAFAENVPKDIEDVDLLIVIGTSLRVAPANSIVAQVPKSAMRVLVNREEAGGHLGMDFDEQDPTRDFFAQGECDAVFLELMDSLGWIDELEYLLPNKLLPDSSAALLREYLAQRRNRHADASS